MMHVICPFSHAQLRMPNLFAVNSPIAYQHKLITQALAMR